MPRLLESCRLGQIAETCRGGVNPTLFQLPSLSGPLFHQFQFRSPEVIVLPSPFGLTGLDTCLRRRLATGIGRCTRDPSPFENWLWYTLIPCKDSFAQQCEVLVVSAFALWWIWDRLGWRIFCRCSPEEDAEEMCSQRVKRHLAWNGASAGVMEKVALERGRVLCFARSSVGGWLTKGMLVLETYVQSCIMNLLIWGCVYASLYFTYFGPFSSTSSDSNLDKSRLSMTITLRDVRGNLSRTEQSLLGWGELLRRSAVPSLLLPNDGHGEMGSRGQCGDAFLRVPILTIWQSPGQQLQSAWLELNANDQWTGCGGFAVVPGPNSHDRSHFMPCPPQFFYAEWISCGYFLLGSEAILNLKIPLLKPLRVIKHKLQYVHLPHTGYWTNAQRSRCWCCSGCQATYRYSLDYSFKIRNWDKPSSISLEQWMAWQIYVFPIVISYYIV